MKKQIKYFLVILLFFVLAGTATVNAAKFEPSNPNIAGTAEDEVIYVIGTHLFTEETSYISSQMMMYAARSINLPSGVEGEDALAYMKIYSRDLEGNWINALNGEEITFEDGFKFDIKYTDLETFVATSADVSTVEEMEEALADNNIKTINVTGDFTTDHSIVVSREVTINGNDKTINFTGAKGTWVMNGDNYVLKVYNTKATVNGLKLTGANAAMLVGSSDVTLKGTIDVSGNAFGGIEVSKGSAVETMPKLDTTDATLVNTDEAITNPTIWEDGVTECVTTNLEVVTGVKVGQVFYFNTMPEANVSSTAELEAALKTNLKVINIADSFTTDHSIVVSRPVTINGNGKTISFETKPTSWNSNGDNYVLKIYNTKDVTIKDIALSNSNAAMLVGSSTVTLVGTIDVSGNVFGGIEVSKSSNADLEEPYLLATGATLVNTDEAVTYPTIWEDGINSDKTKDWVSTNLTSANVKDNQLFYFINEIVTANDEETLKDALTAGAEEINMVANVTLTEDLVLDKDVAIKGQGGAILTVADNAKIVVPNGTTLTIDNIENNGEIVIGSATRSFARTVTTVATLVVNDTLKNVGSITNYGVITLDVNGKITDTTVNNYGTIEKYVDTEAGLENALADETINKIVLKENIDLSKTMNVTRDVTLELNGKTIDSSNVSGYAFNVTSGKFTVNGEGTITTQKVSDYRNIKNEGATVEINNVTMIGYYNVDTNKNTSTDLATTTINNSNLNAFFACVTGWTKSIVNINNSNLTGYYFAVSGNGTACDAEFNITDSTLISETDVVVYMPSTKTLNITNCTLEGATGIEAVAGNTTITNSTIKATGAYTEEAKLPNGTSGTWVEGSAIFVRAQKPYNNGGELTITIDDKTTLSSENGDGIRIHEDTKNTEAAHGVNSVTVQYYSENITAGTGNALKVEKLSTSFVTITTEDLSNQ